MTTYAPDTHPDLEPDVVHWQPTHRGVLQQPVGVLTPTALAAVAGLAVGAMAVGALAIGALVIGRLTIGRARLHVLDIDQLNIGAIGRLES